MSGTLDHDGARDRIAAVVDHHLRRLQLLAALVTDAVGSRPDPSAALPETAFRGVRDHLDAWLDGSDAAFGYGFVAAPGVVEGRERYLFWFQHSDRGLRRLRLNFDSRDINVYDYLHMDWYTKAQQSLGPALYGPYVDYTGSDRFVLTLSIPVVHEGRFLGVAGSDLLMSWMEVELTPVLNQVEAETLVVNADRQVVISNSARWIPGDRLAVHPLRDGSGFGWVSELVRGTGFTLASRAGGATP
jgi:hypothetical protein